jgi:Zn-dependent protease with chaperone function
MLTSEAREILAAVWPDEAATPTRLVTCRYCRQRNRVVVSTAVLDTASCECGACRQPLFLRPDEPLTAISSTSYEHSLDRKSLEALKSVPGFPAAMRWIMSNAGERTVRLLFRSSAIECGPEQFPELVALLDRARTSLDLPYRPALFVTESPVANAMTTGAEDPILVVHSALLDALNDQQVVSVLGHELGHLHADHPLYKTMAQLLVLGGTALAGPAGQLLSIPLRAALAKWSRCAELTADRAGLLATRDLGTSLSILMTLAGGHREGVSGRTKLNLKAYVQQARRLVEQEEESLLDSVFAVLITLETSHPFLTWRVMQLIEWVEHGNYLDILAGDYARVQRDLNHRSG